MGVDKTKSQGLAHLASTSASRATTHPDAFPGTTANKVTINPTWANKTGRFVNLLEEKHTRSKEIETIRVEFSKMIQNGINMRLHGIRVYAQDETEARAAAASGAGSGGGGGGRGAARGDIMSSVLKMSAAADTRINLEGPIWTAPKEKFKGWSVLTGVLGTPVAEDCTLKELHVRHHTNGKRDLRVVVATKDPGASCNFKMVSSCRYVSSKERALSLLKRDTHDSHNFVLLHTTPTGCPCTNPSQTSSR